VAYNLLQGAGPLISVTDGSEVKSVGNVVNGNGGFTTGVESMDPKLTMMGEIFRISAGSPVIDQGDGTMFPFITDDIDGRPRVKPDIGAQEVSDTPAKWGLLTEKDVGPEAP
jgi:hypothetical protein